MDQNRVFSSNRSQAQPLTKKSQNPCHTEIRDLFKKLKSWREESNRQFYNIMNSHSRNIDNGFRDLESELSDMREEKNVLLQTVDDLHNEIRQLNVKLQAATENGQYSGMDYKDNDCGEEFLYTPEYGYPRSGISTGYDEREISTEYVAISDEGIKEETKGQANDSGLFIESTFTDDGFDNAGTDVLNAEGVKFEAFDQNQKGIKGRGKRGPYKKKKQLVNSDYSSSKGYKKAKNQACHLCDYTAAHRNNLTYHLIKVHKIGEMFKCEQCTYESASKGNLKAHVEGVHEKLRKYACSECDYAGFRRSEWIKHQKTKRHQNRRTIGIGIGI